MQNQEIPKNNCIDPCSFKKKISKPFHNSLWFLTSHVLLRCSTVSLWQKLLRPKAYLMQQWHQLIKIPKLGYSSLKANQQFGLLREEEEVMYSLYLTPGNSDTSVVKKEAAASGFVFHPWDIAGTTFSVVSPWISPVILHEAHSSTWHEKRWSASCGWPSWFLVLMCTSAGSGKGKVRVLPVGCRWACQLSSVMAGRGTCCTLKGNSKFCKHCETCLRVSDAHKE